MAQMFRSAFKSLIRPFEPSRKCFHSNYYYLDDPNQPQLPPNIDLEAPIVIAGETRNAVHVEDFTRHVSQLHADGDIGFSKEYELIQNESIVDEHSSEHSQHSDNKAKNRYLNIIACKYTSVFVVVGEGLTCPFCVNLGHLNQHFHWANVLISPPFSHPFSTLRFRRPFTRTITQNTGAEEGERLHQR